MRRLVVLLLIFILTLLMALPVLAISDPTSTNIFKVHATQNVLESGDLLIMAEYEINYASTPNETIADAFIFRLIDTDGTTELGRVLAYPYVNKGYGKGVISYYFDNSTAPGTDQYIIRIMGNPAVFSTAYSRDFQLPTSAYTAYFSDTDADIKAQVLIYSTDLNPTYFAALSAYLHQSDGTNLSLTTTGEVYFLNSIPNLRNMSPSLFSVQQRQATPTVDSYNGTQASAYTSRFVGTWVADSTDAFGDLLNTDAQIAMGIIVVVLCVLWAIVTVKLTGTAQPAFLLMATTLLAGTLLGFVSMAVTSAIVFLCGLYAGIIIIGRGLPG